MFSSSTRNLNLKTKISNTIAIKDNLSYIAKFGLFASVTQYIDFYSILNNIHIDNSTTVLDMKLKLWIFNFLESY